MTIKTESTVEEFLANFGFLCDPEDGGPGRDMIARVDLYYEEQGSWAETDLCAVFELTDGQWASVVSWCDTTGYGCRDGTDWYVSAHRDQVINLGLDLGSRIRLGLALDPNGESDSKEGPE